MVSGFQRSALELFCERVHVKWDTCGDAVDVGVKGLIW